MMGEHEPSTQITYPEISALLEECTRQIEHPPNIGGEIDTHHVRCMKGLAAELTDGSLVSEEITKPMLVEAIRVKGHDGALAIGSMRASVNWLVAMTESGNMTPLNSHELDLGRYPWSTDSEWRQFWQKVFDEPDLMGHMATNMMMYNNSTNEPNRVISPKLVALTSLSERIKDSTRGFSILNFGAAFNYEIVMLEANLPLPHIGVDFTHAENLNKIEWENRVNNILGSPVPVLRATGVDLMPLTDAEWRLWGQACCYFIEMRGEERKQKRRQLDEIRDASPHIRHVAARVGHLAEEQPNRFNNYLLDLRPDNPYTLVVANTMMHMNNPEEQRKIFDEMVERTEPGGRVVITDFVSQFDGDIDERRLSHPLDRVRIVTPTSKPFMYTTLVYDPQEPSKGIKEPFRLLNGRGGKIRPSSYGWRLIKTAYS